MDAALVNAQRPQALHAAAEHTSNGVRERSVRAPRSATHSRPAYARQGKSLSARTISRPAAKVDHSAVGAATADQRQAEYFVRLLTQSRRRIDQRIDKYQTAIAISEASGDADNVRGFRRMMRVEEQDRRTVQDLIEKMQRRFPLRASGEVPQSPRRARPAVR